MLTTEVEGLMACLQLDCVDCFPPPSTFYLLLGSRDILLLSLFAHLSASCLITPVGRRDLITSNTFDASAELHALFGKPFNLRDVSFARVLRHP